MNMNIMREKAGRKKLIFPAYLILNEKNNK
jgi:hypothetical protein